MTAISLIVQAGEAHLLTDAAFYDRHGIVRWIASKVAVSRHWPMAIAVSGAVEPRRVSDALGNPPSAADALAALPDIADALHRENQTTADHPDRAGKVDFQLYVARWCPIRKRGEGYVLSTDQAWFGPDYTPFALAEAEQAIGPPIAKGGVDPRRFNAGRDGPAILAEQRRHTAGWGGQRVGGFGELTSVGRYGVQQRRLVTWPDKNGEPIAA